MVYRKKHCHYALSYMTMEILVVLLQCHHLLRIFLSFTKHFFLPTTSQIGRPRPYVFFLANGTNLKSQMDFPTHFQTLLFITISGEEIIPQNLLVLILGISGNDRFVAQLVEETFKMPPWSFCLLHNLVLFFTLAERICFQIEENDKVF